MSDIKGFAELEAAGSVSSRTDKRLVLPSKRAPLNVFIPRWHSVSPTIMGGSKKRSMAQMEKTQDSPDKGKDESATPGKKGGKAKTVAEKRARGLQAPDLNDPKFIGEVGKMSAITPYSLASQFNVKLSVAKDLLEELERRKMVTLVGGNARIRIYQPAAA